MIFRIGSLLLVWAIVLLAIGMVDRFLGTPLQLIVAIWICFGFWLLLHRKMPLRMSKADQPDVQGAWNAIWQALCWPKYIFQK